MVASTLDAQLSTLDRGSDATFGCGGAALCETEFLSVLKMLLADFLAT